MNSLFTSVLVVVACGGYGVMFTSHDDFVESAKRTQESMFAAVSADELVSLECQSPRRTERSTGAEVVDVLRIERDFEDERVWRIFHDIQETSFDGPRARQQSKDMLGFGKVATSALTIATPEANAQVERGEQGLWEATLTANLSSTDVPAEALVCKAYRR